MTTNLGVAGGERRRERNGERGAGTRGIFPSTWLGRGLKVEYEAGDEVLATDATLLDVCPFGPVLNVAGARTLLSWEKIILVELVE